MTASRPGIMKRFVCAAIVFALLLGGQTGWYVKTAAAEGSPSVSYEFNEDGNLEGWMKNYHSVAQFKVQEGSLQLKLDQTDPFWYAPTPVGLQTSADQTLTVRMKTNNGASLAIYFDTDVNPGLAEAKRLVIPVKADGEFHEYTVKPSLNSYWKGTVQKMRLDLEPANSVPADVSIDYLRIAEHSDYGFEFNGTADGWSSLQDLSPLRTGTSGVSADITGSHPSAVSGAIGQPAEKLGEMKIRTKVSGNSAQTLTVGFNGQAGSGFPAEDAVSVPLNPDGQYHEYTVKLWEHPSWIGSIGQIKLSLDGAAEPAGGTWEVDYVRFQSVALPSYDWNTDGNAQGWLPLHDFTPFEISGGVLRTKVAGSDPYIANENVEGVIGERDKTLTVRMSATAGNYVSIFFATDSTPSYAETRRIDFTIQADGNMHDYTIAVGDHPQWKGKIIKLRLDIEGGDRSAAVLTLDEVKFVSSPAGGQLSVKRSKPALHAGDEADVSVEIANTGGKKFFHAQAELVASNGLEIVGEALSSPLGDLAPGGKAVATWKVKATAESPASVEVKLHAAGYDQSYSVSLPVLKATEAPGSSSDRPSAARALVDPATGDAVLENATTRFVAPKSEFGYGQYQVYAWDDVQGWKLMASAQPFAAAIVKQDGNKAETVGFYPATVTAGSPSGKAGLTFQGTATDSSGRVWTYSFDFALGTGDDRIVTGQSVHADRDAQLLNMTGPVLTVGEGSFGAGKDEALFPGLEWLTGGESSSSQLDVHTPAYLRLVPHPYKITVPLMAVRQDKHIVSLSWDPKQKWDGEHDLPAAKFASPNWVENQNNHVMGLSALSVPTYVKENQELAETAYALPAGRDLTLKAGISTIEADSVAEAVSAYVKDNGIPSVPQVRSFEEQVDLGLDAYLRTYWDPVTKGWRHVNIPSWGTNQFPADMVSLKLLGTAAPERKPEIETVLSQALGAMADKKKLGDPDYHIPQFQAPFLVGYMDQALAGLKKEMDALIADQDPSGAWLYKNAAAYNPPLGENGTPMFGQTAQNVKHLLKYVAMTGDSQAKEAGFKGLAAIEGMGGVPRTSQPWEVPLHTPDILAAGHAVGAYLAAYDLTGKTEYLDKAKEWAKRGLPFVYTWGVQDRPLMEYATIPIFGASAYINPWFAVPVQWNGLVYAYELLDLANYDGQGPWKQVADGILASAEIQQASGSDETWRGGYPDNWRLIANSRSDTVMLNPEEIVKVLFMQRFVEGKGPNPDIRTVAVPGCPNPDAEGKTCAEAKVTSLADIRDKSPSNTQHLLSFGLKYPAGETTYSLVAGREAPRMVTVNDVKLSEQADLTNADTGWSYLGDSGMLVLKIRHSAADDVKIHY
ncbi:hypothetical protein [Cohnella candidum]|uniref:Alpha-galactosidase NEW3 domain-containing protein n=1 Tax=Cohnella candidum TaxID=2674991 RepID=A0A3G3JXC4_9BACL|nr:hypothetical protein [Cohnella candidum]AYQ72903.1 hypothetical protein EAV92_10215 [Cohnella candidum]